MKKTETNIKELREKYKDISFEEAGRLARGGGSYEMVGARFCVNDIAVKKWPIAIRAEERDEGAEMLI